MARPLFFHIHTSDNKSFSLARSLSHSPPTQYVFSKITVDECLRRNRIVSSRLDSQLRDFFSYSYQHTRMIIESSMTSVGTFSLQCPCSRVRFLHTIGTHVENSRIGSDKTQVPLRIYSFLAVHYLSIELVKGPATNKRECVLPCSQSNIDVDCHRLVVASGQLPHVSMVSLIIQPATCSFDTHIAFANIKRPNEWRSFSHLQMCW